MRPNVQVLVLLVENTSGVMARISGLFARRGFNIESLNVAPTQDPSLSRFTIVLDEKSAEAMDQVKKQLSKLVNVIELKDLSAGGFEEQELMVVKVKAPEEEQEAIKKLGEKYSIKILSKNSSGMILSMTGLPNEVLEMIEILRKYDIEEIQHSGRVAIAGL